MYQIGDYVVYGSTGVCQVAGVETPSGCPKGQERLFYVLKPLYRTETIFAPVSGGKVSMRPVISGAEANRLIEEIPSLPVHPYSKEQAQPQKGRPQFTAEIHSCADLMALAMSNHAKKAWLEGQKRKVGAVDSKFTKQVEELLFGELAVALSIPKDSVEGYIHERVAALEVANG